MSLIHQALKKLEGARKAHPQAGARPVPAGKGPGRRKVNAALAVVFIVAVTAGLAAYTYLNHLKNMDIKEVAALQQTGEPGIEGPASQHAPPTGAAPPGPVDHVERGTIFFGAGDYTRAASEFRAAVAAEPDNPVYRNNLGLSLFRAGDVEGAEKAFREALGLRPGYPEGLNNYGTLLAARGKHDLALEMFGKAVNADPGYADAYLNRAVILEDSGRTKEAVDAYGKYLGVAGDGEMKTRVRRKIAELKAGMIMDRTIR